MDCVLVMISLFSLYLAFINLIKLVQFNVQMNPFLTQQTTTIIEITISTSPTTTISIHKTSRIHRVSRKKMTET